MEYFAYIKTFVMYKTSSVMTSTVESDITSEFQAGMLQDRYDPANMGAPCFSTEVLDVCLVAISESLRFTKVDMCQSWNGYSLLDRQAMPSTNVKA